jgi:hypothetical protein
MTLTPKQTEAMNALQSEKYNFILYGGAIRGGKTVWGLSSLLVMCQVFPGSRWCVIRENMEKIRTTTIPSFLKLNPSGKLKQSPYEYIHPNGSVILFKSESYATDKELDWMKGLEVNGFLFEEINECQEKTFNKAFERSGSWVIPNLNRQPKPIILATCNPTFGWVKDRVYDPWKKETLPAKWLYIPSKITDNVDENGKSNLPQEYIESLQNMPKFEYMVFVEGNWDIQIKTGGEFYKQFELSKHVGHTAYNPALPLHVSWDDNVNPYLPCGIFQLVNTKVYMIDEIAGETPNNTAKAVCAEIKRKYPAHSSGMFIYGDATAKKEDTKMEKGHNFYTLIMEYLKEYRPVNRVSNSNPSVVMRGNWINTVFETRLGNIEVVIGEHCKKAITDFVSLKESPDGTKHKETEKNSKTGVTYQKYGHFSDLFDYLMTTAFKAQYDNYSSNRKTSISKFSGVFQ